MNIFYTIGKPVIALFPKNSRLLRFTWIKHKNIHIHYYMLSVQFSSVAQSCPTLWDPMNCSTSGLPVHHQLLEFTQTHVHWVSDAIQPSHPLSSPSPPVPNPSQHQSLFQWVNSSHEVYIYFMGNRWGNSGNSVRLYFLGLQNHCRWWLQPWN